MTADIELLPLYAELQGHPKLEIIKHYARANVEHHTEALRAEIDALRSRLEVLVRNHLNEQCRAWRLAEALREATDILLPDYPETAKRLRTALTADLAQHQEPTT